ncbi:MAG: hypothetical protein WKF37_15675 [Bryobacteraceae bacterium]
MQLGGPALNYTDPWRGTAGPFQPNFFPRPTTMLTEDASARPPYAQNWNLSIQHALPADMVIEARYVGTKGTRLPRFIEANPSVYRPGDSPNTVDARRLFANCDPGGQCDFASVGLLSYASNSTYHARQTTLSRRFNHGLAFSTSYWFSKTLDYVSSMNVAGSAPRLVSGEMMSQNPLDLSAEHGPSLFDAKHRWTGMQRGRCRRLAAQRHSRCVLWNAVHSLRFRNVAQQGSHPEISGFSGSRPDVVSDPNRGPRTVEQWVSPAPSAGSMR